MFLVNGVKISVYEEEALLYERVAKKLFTSRKNIKNIKIIKKSIDARKKPCSYVYSVAVEVFDEKGIKADRYESKPPLKISEKSFKKRPLVVGFGPAGMLCAYILAKSGAKPIVIERGRDVEKRAVDINAFRQGDNFNPESNICYGEGGAGTFSDGKLGTGISSPYISYFLQLFHSMGAPEDILYSAKPHVGSDILPTVCKNIREEIIKMGGEIRFGEKVSSIITENGKICAAVTDKGILECDILVLAIGHSARETFEMLYNMGVKMEAKPFSVGARIEHLQKDISFAQYGEDYKHMPAADYKLVHHLQNGVSVYSFCMCPGGYVTNSSSGIGEIVTNGYSFRKRDGENANSALLVSVTPENFGFNPMAGIAFQRGIEKSAYESSFSYKAPAQLVGDFLKGVPSKEIGDINPSYDKGVKIGDISCCLPTFAVEALREGIKAFANKIRGFDRYDSVLTAPETRSSSPVKIMRDEKMESNIKGLYPIGEGSGYAGGITSSAVDGIKAALMITERNDI